MFSEGISRFLIHHVGQTTYFGFVGALLFAVPLMLVWLAIAQLISGGSRG